VVRGLGRRAKLHVIEGADHGFGVLVRSGRTAADVMAELATTIAEWMARVAAPGAGPPANRTKRRC
jgi:predicted alpha/beta-hydrolase family hydrolase